MENRQTRNDWQDSSDQHNLVAFRLGQQIYALPIKPIVQIIEMVAITPIPQVGDTVEGVINVHGVAVSVVNLRRHLGLPDVAFQLRTPIMLVQTGEQMIGLIVDEVLDVIGLSIDQVARLADILPEGLGEAPILQGLAHVQNDTVLLLDLEHLFLPHQARALAQAAATLPAAMAEETVEEAESVPATARAEDWRDILVEEVSGDVGAGG
jgi:purine-binding chemotaxis protein CheW